VKIGILGAGAVGCAYGHLLHRGGQEVILVDVWADHVERIRRSGLTIEGADEPAAGIEATTDPSDLRGVEAVLVLVKAFANEAVGAALAAALEPGVIVVTLQNGIGNVEVLAHSLGLDRVVQGSTTVAAQVQGPGRVSIADTTLDGRSLTALGRPSSAVYAAVCERLARALEQASLPTIVLDDVRGVVWRKMAMAAAIGPLCAILDCTVADVLERPTALDVLRQTFAEVVRVAAAEGVALDVQPLWSDALETYRLIGPHPPSLAVDVTRGRPSEIEAQLGEVVRRAQTAGIPTPAADVLATVIRAKTPVAR
jgi:2-dehydropantoate 2-reductase